MRYVTAGFGVSLAALGAALVTAAPRAGDAAAGKAAFGQCAACHSLASGRNGVGPSLAGVLGRRVASVQGYAYSQALQSGRGRSWSAAMLDSFLANPNSMFPGNKMGIAVPDPDKRADIVAYLGQAEDK